MNDLISVIIPVYRVEPYLRECLDSVLASTYQNLEIILVDDGSPDNCGVICDEYAAKDSRIIVIHQENQGLSAARNTGLSIATGKYVGFVDSDDVISPVMYEQLLWAMQETDADIAACEYCRNMELLESVGDMLRERLFEFCGFNDCLAVITRAPASRALTWTSCAVWNKLYLRNKVVPFDQDVSFSEDLWYNYHCIKNIDKLVVHPKRMYYYRNNVNSMVNTLSNKNAVCMSNIWCYLADDAQCIDFELKEYLLGISTAASHNAAWRIICSGDEANYSDFVAYTCERVKKYFSELMACKDVSLMVRIPAILCRYFYPAWKLAAKLYNVCRGGFGKK